MRWFPKTTLRCTALLSALLLLPSHIAGAQDAQRNDADTAGVRADVQKALKGGRFAGVHIDTEGSALVLSGQVPLLEDKLDAGKKAEKRAAGLTLRNSIEVAVPEGLSDQQLLQKLAKKIAYERAGYGTLVFCSYTLQVRNGVVTVGGLAATPPDKDAALGDIAATEGVRDLVDHVQVAPVSPLDNRIRQSEAAAIYSASQLQRYALDPGRPIRILVVNGHVTLEGVVDDAGDRVVAEIRAKGVPGVFSVEDHLQVAGQGASK